MATFSGQESGGLQDQLLPVQKTQDLQDLLAFHCGLQTSLPTSLHGLHLSYKESESLRKSEVIKGGLPLLRPPTARLVQPPQSRGHRRPGGVCLEVIPVGTEI